MQGFALCRETRSLHFAGTKTGDADAARFQFVTQTLREPHDGKLRAGVGGVTVDRDDPTHRANQNDLAVATCEHGGQHRFDNIPGAVEVDLNDSVEGFELHVNELRRAADAGHVNENVRWAGFSNCCSDGADHYFT